MTRVGSQTRDQIQPAEVSVLSVRVPTSLRAELKQQATVNERDLSGEVRYALRRYLQRDEGDRR